MRLLLDEKMENQKFTEEKYNEFQSECEIFKKRVSIAENGCKLPLYTDKVRIKGKKSYSLNFVFRIKSGYYNELATRQRDYARMFVNSVIFRLHYIIVNAKTNSDGDFEIMVRPDWSYFIAQ